MTRKNITLVFVFIAAIYWGIWLGGYIFNATMVAPSWSYDPPVSITNYMSNSHFLAYFFTLVNPWVFLVSLITWLLARKVDTAARPWLGRAALIAWIMLPLKVWMIIQIGGVFGAARAGTF